MDRIKLRDAGYRERVFAKSLIADMVARWTGCGPSHNRFCEEMFSRALRAWLFDTRSDVVVTDDGAEVKVGREGSSSLAILRAFGMTDAGC